LEFFWRDANDFLSRLVTMNETWLYHHDPEIKQQSMELQHSGSPCPQKLPSAKIRWRSSRLDFFGIKTAGILLIDYLLKGQTINAEYFSSPLVQLKDILKETRRGKFTKGVLFLHDIASAHRHLQARRNWSTWASNVLITHLILRIWPRRTTTCSLD